MLFRAVIAVFVVLGLAFTSGSAQAADGHLFEPGAAGVGDPYYPLDGNGGYDVDHYVLDVRYQPETDVLTGVAVIIARATQNLSSFNLDLDGLTVRSVTVGGSPAQWSRAGNELTVMPRRGLQRGTGFTVIVHYDGIPRTITDAPLDRAGFVHTDDGAVVIGQPDVAATWFPVNDHPIDKAAYTIRVSVPEGLEAVANGVLLGRTTMAGWTAWTWQAKEPMASYLATATIGQFELSSYEGNGIRFWDAIDSDILASITAPRTGKRFAVSQRADLTYKRLSRRISVPASGADMSFWITRNTESTWDHAFVEAHTVGADDWTTLPDRNGHTLADTGQACPFWLDLHPFLSRYQSATGGGNSCLPNGTTGTWSAATGASKGYEQWSIDLSRYAGREVEVSISYASDDVVQNSGVFVDDIAVSTGEGTTSFEDDGDTLDGWTVPGAPTGSATNENDWISGTVADTAPTVGGIIKGSLDRQSEIIEFLAGIFGPYSFSAGGAIVDDTSEFGYALENQTRPIYAKAFFSSKESGDSVIVHELAHQWYGNSLAVAGWKHIWLNEGFATYAQWLWSEHEGLGTAQQIFDSRAATPADSPFWKIKIGDPGPGNLFDEAVYHRGAMTLHQLRLAVGDETFFRILRLWSTSKAGRNVTTDEFIALAEEVSGQQLDALFDTWLFTATKPGLPAPGAPEGFRPAGGARYVPPAAREHGPHGHGPPK